MQESIVVEKQCVKCQKSFALNNDNFPINKKTKDGFQNECKGCFSLRNKELYLKNKKKRIKQVLKNRKLKNKLIKSGQNPAIPNQESLANIEN